MPSVATFWTTTWLNTHPQWGPYLTKRSQLVADLAEYIRASACEWTPATAPVWARPLLANQPQLMAEIAVFRAAHDVDPADTRITGPEQHANRSAAIQQLIAARLNAAISRGETGAQRWKTMAENLDPHITTDPFWPRLATHLDEAARAGADVAQLLTEAISLHGPLPDELPAAALWWRLAGTLTPPTVEAANTRLRPPWTPELHRLLGSRIAETIIADPAWPSLVAAVAASGWPPADLLSAAAEHLLDIAATEALRPDEYARLLTYRVELLTHHAATIDPDIPTPPTPPHRTPAASPGRPPISPTPPPTPTPTSRRPTPTTTPTVTPKTPWAHWTSPTCPCAGPSPQNPESTSTSPRCAPGAAPPTAAPEAWRAPSCATAADPPNKPPQPNSRNYATAIKNSATTSTTWPTPTPTGSAPNTPQKSTNACSTTSAPTSPPPNSAATPSSPRATAATATSSPNTPPRSTPRSNAHGSTATRRTPPSSKPPLRHSGRRKEPGLVTPGSGDMSATA
jgi:hypothetical protein